MSLRAKFDWRSDPKLYGLGVNLRKDKISVSAISAKCKRIYVKEWLYHLCPFYCKKKTYKWNSKMCIYLW